MSAGLGSKSLDGSGGPGTRTTTGRQHLKISISDDEHERALLTRVAELQNAAVQPCNSHGLSSKRHIASLPSRLGQLFVHFSEDGPAHSVWRTEPSTSAIIKGIVWYRQTGQRANTGTHARACQHQRIFPVSLDSTRRQ